MSARNHSLDVLRGIAVLLVMCYHFPLIPVLSRIGWCGVDLFFVLSGYLVSGLLFREYQNTGSIHLGRFWLRRGLKIWPAQYAFLLLVSPWLIRWPGGPQWSSLRAAALFYSNFAMTVPLVSHTWSLAVEEHFYILLPLLFVGIIRLRNLSLIPYLGAMLICVCMFFRFAFPQGAWSWTECRIDALFVGVALRYAHDFNSSIFRRIAHPINLPAVAALLLSLLASKDHMAEFGFPCLSIAFAIVTAYAIEHPMPHLFDPLARIGIYSYSIYLWQEPLSIVYGGHPSALSFGVFISAAIFSGIGMAKLIEMPVLRLRDRLIPDAQITEPRSHFPTQAAKAHGVVAVQ